MRSTALTESVEEATPALRTDLATRLRRQSVWFGIIGLAIVTLLFSEVLSGLSLYTYNNVLLACLGAIALTVLMGTGGQASIGNSAFLAIGGFSAVYVDRSGLPIALSIIAGTAAAGIAGMIVALPAVRIRGFYLALCTVALFFVVVYVVQTYQHNTVGDSGFFVPSLFASKGAHGAQQYWAWLLFAILSLCILFARRLMSGVFGRSLRMVRSSEKAAAVLGVNVPKLKVTVFGITSAMIGLQGALTLYFIGSLSSDSFTLALAIQYLAMVVVGGADSILGAVIGAALIVSMPTWIPSIVTDIAGSNIGRNDGPFISEMLYGGLLVVFVLASPTGLAGLLRKSYNKIVNLILRPDGSVKVPANVDPDTSA